MPLSLKPLDGFDGCQNLQLIVFRYAIRIKISIAGNEIIYIVSQGIAQVDEIRGFYSVVPPLIAIEVIAYFGYKLAGMKEPRTITA